MEIGFGMYPYVCLEALSALSGYLDRSWVVIAVSGGAQLPRGFGGFLAKYKYLHVCYLCKGASAMQGGQ